MLFITVEKKYLYKVTCLMANSEKIKFRLLLIVFHVLVTMIFAILLFHTF